MQVCQQRRQAGSYSKAYLFGWIDQSALALAALLICHPIQNHYLAIQLQHALAAGS